MIRRQTGPRGEAAHHRGAGRQVLDRFCTLGEPAEHLARLRDLAELGGDHLAVYLQHDAEVQTLQAHGDPVIPQLDVPPAARLP